jgi:hypothetical protein
MTTNVFASAGSGTAVNGVAWTNLPNGYFSPDIFSKKAQIAFRNNSVVQAITNSEYYGEIAEMGDTVWLLTEPDVTVSAYERGQQVTPQFLSDARKSLTVDQAFKFSFTMDDLEKQQANLNWIELAGNRASYKLKDNYDSNVLTFMAGITSTPQIGNSTTAQIVSLTPTGTQMSPLGILNRAKRLLDANNVPDDGRYFVGDPYFYELLNDENSKLLNNDYTDKGILRNGKVSEGMVRGFKLYQSNNLPISGAGPESNTITAHGVLFAGQISAVAAVEQITKTESFRSHNSFAEEVRGLHVFGRGSLRTESLVIIKYNNGTA